MELIKWTKKGFQDIAFELRCEWMKMKQTSSYPHEGMIGVQRARSHSWFEEQKDLCGWNILGKNKFDKK